MMKMYKNGIKNKYIVYGMSGVEFDGEMHVLSVYIQNLYYIAKSAFVALHNWW